MSSASLHNASYKYAIFAFLTFCLSLSKRGTHNNAMKAFINQWLVIIVSTSKNKESQAFNIRFRAVRRKQRRIKNDCSNFHVVFIVQYIPICKIALSITFSACLAEFEKSDFISYRLYIYAQYVKIGSTRADFSRKKSNFEPIYKKNTMTTDIEILQILHFHPMASRQDITSLLTNPPSDSTLKRIIAECVKRGDIEVVGRGPSTKYQLSAQAHVTMPLDIDTYFLKDVDERTVQESFNFSLINETLPKVELFTVEEKLRLDNAQATFHKNVSDMTSLEYRKEMERLGVDLSWKSSQIEGNTYSLLETERLLREKKTAQGKTKEEAVMLLNHKDALDFILENPDYLQEISVRRIEDIHHLLTKELEVDSGIRHRRVGITGTKYRPLDNEFQIREALEDTCQLVNSKANVFEKALLALVLLSYIQAFTDGNKRTARITSNALLLANGYCPISFRTVDSVDYKKAMLMFYEQNNIAAFKKIFIEQFEFAVNTYF